MGREVAQQRSVAQHPGAEEEDVLDLDALSLCTPVGAARALLSIAMFTVSLTVGLRFLQAQLGDVEALWPSLFAPGLLRFAVTLFFLAPLCTWLSSSLPRGDVRHLFNVVMGSVCLAFVFAPDVIALLVGLLVTWRVVMIPSSELWGVLGRLSAPLDPYRHLLALVLPVAMLCSSHANASTRTATNISYHAALMVVLVKLWLLSFNVFDGTVGAPALAAMAAATGDTPSSRFNRRVSAERAAVALPGPPRFLPLLSYILYPGTCLVGPSFEFAVFRGTGQPQATPQPLFPGLAIMLRSLGWAGLNLAILSKFSLTSIISNALGPTPLPLAHQLAYAWMAMAGIRAQYYSAWTAAEGACVLGGEGWDVGTGSWRYAVNVRPMEVEFGGSAAMLRAWNCRTQSWLDGYVHKRLPKSWGKANRFVTFAVSALWHGFHGGYFLAFLVLPLQQAAGEAVVTAFPKVREWARGGVGGVLTWVAQSFGLVFALTAFCLLHADVSLAVWRAWWGYGVVVPVGMLVLAGVVGVGGREKG